MTQPELAEWMSAATGTYWDAAMVSRVETNQRRLDPDELVALCRIFKVPLHDLFKADKDTVTVGRSELDPADYFQVVFWMPEEHRDRMTEVLYGGFKEDEVTPMSHHAWQFAQLRDTVNAVLQHDPHVLDLMVTNPEQGQAVFLRYLRDFMGAEVYNAVVNDPRFWREYEQLDGQVFVDLILGTIKEGEEE